MFKLNLKQVVKFNYIDSTNMLERINSYLTINHHKGETVKSGIIFKKEKTYPENTYNGFMSYDILEQMAIIGIKKGYHSKHNYFYEKDGQLYSYPMCKLSMSNGDEYIIVGDSIGDLEDYIEKSFEDNPIIIVDNSKYEWNLNLTAYQH